MIIGTATNIYTKPVGTRDEPDLTGVSSDPIAENATFNVIVRLTQADGSIWLQLENNRWVAESIGTKVYCRFDAVSVTPLPPPVPDFMSVVVTDDTNGVVYAGKIPKQ